MDPSSAAKGSAAVVVTHSNHRLSCPGGDVVPDRVVGMTTRRSGRAPRPVTQLQEAVSVPTVLICDERRNVRDGLTRLLASIPGPLDIESVAHGDELLARFARQPV